MGEEDIQFMKVALKEAHIAFAEGEVPVGSVLVIDDTVIAKAHNNKECLQDPTGHAELLTKEPCIMCAGAMVNARLRRLVYGCRDEKGGAVDSLYTLLSDKRLNHQVDVVSGVLEEECAEILTRFFREKR